MLETITNFLGNIAIYVAALLGLVALYFLWLAFREWRASQRAAFGIERDMARSEMLGALARASIVVAVGLFVYALGQLGQDAGSESSGETTVQPTSSSIATASLFGTLTPELGAPGPTLIPSDTPLPEITDAPLLPSEGTQPPAVEPTPQLATVIIFGGVWLRDAPNGGTIDVLPQGTVVEFLEGRELAGSYEWQKVKVLSTLPGSQGLVNQEGWVAFAPDFLEVSP